MFGDQFFKLSDELRMASERQFGSDPLLERGQSDLLEPLHRELCERLVSEVGERRTAPEVERLGKEACGRSRVSLCESSACLLGAPLEPLQVELLGREPDDVSGRTGLDRRRAERLAESGDVPLHLRDGGDGSRSRVQVVGESVDRDDAVCVEEQDRQGRALLRPAERDGAVVSKTSSGPRMRNSSTERTVAGR